MIDWKLKKIKEEFLGFRPPAAFAGGCMKSSLISGFCAHLRPDGSIGKIEENCENYESCKKGYRYRYNV